jgi:3-isopropylmalate dehydrogenase
MKALIASLPGDGIGQEVIAEAVSVLALIGHRFGHQFTIQEADVGGIAMDRHGDPLPPATVDLCRRSDAILFGAIGTPKYSDPYAKVKPESALLALRKGFGLFANLRPIVPFSELLDASPLKREIVDGVDILFVRELTGGIYFGDKRRDGDKAYDVCSYSVPEIERVVRVAAGLAQRRRKKLTSVDKANVLQTSFLWREVTTRVVRDEFPDVQLDHQLVDSVAMALITRPRSFDVVVTENLFGDILTDEGSVLTGSLGMLPSASLGTSRPGLFEPVHGSAPDIAGKGVANPLGAMLTVGMLLRHGLDLPREAAVVEGAVARTLAAGLRTPDLARGGASVSTVAMADRVRAEIESAR